MDKIDLHHLASHEKTANRVFGRPVQGVRSAMIWVLASLLVALASPALADVSIGLGLDISGDAQVRTVLYDCKGAEPLTVQYLDAAPNFLALVPVGGQKPLIFVNTISASGAKYQSGKYVWWDKGNDATLTDTTEGLDAAPVLSCTEQNDTCKPLPPTPPSG